MSAAAETLAALRTAVARIEAEGEGASRGGRRVPFGVDAIDGAIGGGLRRGALHAIAGAAASGAAATGFAAALAARAAGKETGKEACKGRAVLWIRQDMAGRESGEPWAPGLAEIGLDPSGLLFLRAPDVDATLRAAEAGLGCEALAAVVIEPFGALRRFDRVAGRRLALAARRSGVMGLLLRVGADGFLPAGLSAAETCWRVSPLASGEAEDWGRPRALAELVRNRLGTPGRWPLEWDGDDGRFSLLRDDARAREDGAAGRPAAPPGARFVEPADRSGAAAREAFGFRRAG